MSGLQVIRISVKPDKIIEFLDEYSAWSIGIAKMYQYDDKIEIVTNVELLSYYEFVELYKDMKDYVNDVWCLIVGDTILEAGKDINDDHKWESAKKLVEEEETDED